MTGAVELALIAICGLAAAAASVTICIRTGAALGRTGFRQRSTQPKAFWMYVTFWAFCAFGLGLAVSAGFIGTVFGPS